MMTDNTSPQKGFFQPPKLAERILSLLLTPEDAEIVLGDFAELCNQQNSQERANNWYWRETLYSAPALLQLKLSRQFERSFTVMNKNHIHMKFPVMSFVGKRDAKLKTTRKAGGLEYRFIPLIRCPGPVR